MNAKMLGAAQLVGAIIAVLLGFFDNMFLAIIMLSIVFIVTAIHHFTEEHTV